MGTTVWIPEDLAQEIDTLAKSEMRTRSAMANVLIRKAIKQIKAAVENPRPYPAVAECPADTDREA